MSNWQKQLESYEEYVKSKVYKQDGVTILGFGVYPLDLKCENFKLMTICAGKFKKEIFLTVKNFVYGDNNTEKEGLYTFINEMENWISKGELFNGLIIYDDFEKSTEYLLYCMEYEIEGWGDYKKFYKYIN